MLVHVNIDMELIKGLTYNMSIGCMLDVSSEVAQPESLFEL